MPANKRRNPFYILLIPAGLAFVVTAFAYGYMSFQVVNGLGAEANRYSSHPLFFWLRAHGDAALLVELAVLAVLTVGAIAYDSWAASEASAAQQFDVTPSEKRT